MRRGALLPLWLLLVWGISWFSCAPSEEAKVREVLEARRLGLEKKDIGLYMASISARYGQEPGAVERLRRQAMQMMQGCDSIQMRVTDRRIWIRGDRAEALQAYEIRIRRAGQVRVVEGRERIGLEREAGGWKITSGL
ncbi:MAG: hypothetical protein QHH30_05840 [candidate division NC10 bacterium]|nr:hypothetical protein [candidate division NC10 bacterium]